MHCSFGIFFHLLLRANCSSQAVQSSVCFCSGCSSFLSVPSAGDRVPSSFFRLYLRAGAPRNQFIHR
ncbi:hypothetical protein PF007_g31318 [Phytophthora fragariae]|uniref:Secreted protein n=1 Tax=Phytophthora fragariae TaxID=53985 RepID=A0A6A3PP82_9STRA|nr:hypothetical protein PF003_g35225 [Phytophthora fragariae]KAE9058395.1 hypothetical protein PF007_g31318 [Phytophthora fragariae]